MLGRGSYGTVWLVRDTETGVQYAMKEQAVGLGKKAREAMLTELAINMAAEPGVGAVVDMIHFEFSPVNSVSCAPFLSAPLTQGHSGQVHGTDRAGVGERHAR